MPPSGEESLAETIAFGERGDWDCGALAMGEGNSDGDTNVASTKNGKIQIKVNVPSLNRSLSSPENTHTSGHRNHVTSSMKPALLL